jgi:hypothetical protein
VRVSLLPVPFLDAMIDFDGSSLPEAAGVVSVSAVLFLRSIRGERRSCILVAILLLNPINASRVSSLNGSISSSSATSGCVSLR